MKSRSIVRSCSTPWKSTMFKNKSKARWSPTRNGHHQTYLDHHINSTNWESFYGSHEGTLPGISRLKASYLSLLPKTQGSQYCLYRVYDIVGFHGLAVVAENSCGIFLPDIQELRRTCEPRWGYLNLQRNECLPHGDHTYQTVPTDLLNCLLVKTAPSGEICVAKEDLMGISRYGASRFLYITLLYLNLLPKLWRMKYHPFHVWDLAKFRRYRVTADKPLAGMTWLSSRMCHSRIWSSLAVRAPSGSYLTRSV